MIYFAALALAMTLGLGLACLGAALGQGKIGGSAMEAIARQPEAARVIQLNMIIALALVESLAIYALLVSLLLFFLVGLPKTDAVLSALQSMPR